MAKPKRRPMRRNKSNRTWNSMLNPGVRERMARESTEAVEILDHIQTIVPCPVDGTGWTVFNDWLDDGYRRMCGSWPPNLHYIDLNKIRTLVFPR